jgi:hypothetical protein
VNSCMLTDKGRSSGDREDVGDSRDGISLKPGPHTIGHAITTLTSEGL